MSRTWDILVIDKPVRFPHTETIVCEKSITSIGATEKVDRGDGNLYFVAAPTYFSSPCIERRLCLSENKNEKVDFPASLVGEVVIDGCTVHLFLELVG